MNAIKPNSRKTDLTMTSALDASLAAERQAKEVLDRAMRRAMDRSTLQPKEDPTHGKS